MYGMNQAYNNPDPSAHVPGHILQHVHLISSYRFPALPALQPAQALEYLIKGPQITRDTSPVAWTYFPSPLPDGTIILTWQPPRMGAHYASDGMVWADVEQMFDVNVRGYSIQIAVHNSGYIYGHEQYTMHARYRYRIAAGPGTIDPNLWLVHYRPAEPAHRMPASQIPVSREVQDILRARAQLQSAGPLMRKEFMLVDQANWPKVEFGQLGQPAMRAQQQPYYNPMQPGRPYPVQPPPAKRQRVPAQPQARQPVAGLMLPDTSLEDDENAAQDAFDVLTPREISLSRYKQHHEWMEEIFSSPYAVGKIAPIDLGLGLMGELAPLTAGIFDVPGAETPEASRSEYNIKTYYKLEPEQLQDFEKRVSDYTAREQAEIDKMKADHARKIAQLKRNRTYIKAERRLRDLSIPSDSDAQGTDPVEDVVHNLERSLGVKFGVKASMVCVDKGGFIEAKPPSPPEPPVLGEEAPTNANSASNGLNNDGTMVDNSASGLLDQYGTGSLSGTPIGNISLPRLSQPPSQAQSAAGTPGIPSGNAGQMPSFDHDTNLDMNVGDELLDLDVEMSGITGTGDMGREWAPADSQAGEAASSSSHAKPATTQQQAATNSGGLPTANVEGEPGSMFDSTDFGNFGSLDSAGDALADYGQDGNLGLDLVDDSAFGDAFHGTEMHHGEGGEGDGA